MNRGVLHFAAEVLLLKRMVRSSFLKTTWFSCKSRLSQHDKVRLVHSTSYCDSPTLVTTTTSCVSGIPLTRARKCRGLFHQWRISHHVARNRQILARKMCQSTEEKAVNSTCLLKMSPHEFQQLLKSEGIRRCFVVFDGEKLKVSHPVLEDLAESIMKEPSFREHEAMFFELGVRTGALMGAFLWRTSRGQGYGGIRMWSYPTVGSFLQDGMRLSVSNGVKSALAGLWVGGGQGIIPELPNRQHALPVERQKLMFDYGDFLSGLNGCFVGTEDLGLNVYDINHAHSRSRYVTGISEDMGGLGTPAFAAGKGVVCAMEAALDFMKLGSLKGKTVAVQGVGNVGSVVVSELLDKGVSHIYATDCLQKHVDDVRDLLAQKAKGRLEIVKVPFEDSRILSQQCDILSPCALGNVLNQETIPSINARIVCGAANNQLGSEADSQLMTENNIIYVVDYVANRMGLVIQEAEAWGRLPSDPTINRHFSHDWENSIFHMTKQILKRARDENITPAAAANELAEKLTKVTHPLWPNRAKHIIQSLVDCGWHSDDDFWRKRSNFSSARNIW